MLLLPSTTAIGRACKCRPRVSFQPRPAKPTVLATPETIETVELPAVLKPRVGTGSQGVRLIRERSQLAGLAPEAWLLQECLQHPEVGVVAFLGRATGAFHSACHQFLGARAGFTPTLHGPWRVFRDPAIETQAEQLARGLPLFGTFFLQLLADARSRWLITDVNPRPALRISAAIGADFAVANLADFWGEPTDRMLQPIVGEHFLSHEPPDHQLSAMGDRSEPAPARR